MPGLRIYLITLIVLIKFRQMPKKKSAKSVIMTVL